MATASEEPKANHFDQKRTHAVAGFLVHTPSTYVDYSIQMVLALKKLVVKNIQ